MFIYLSNGAQSRAEKKLRKFLFVPRINQVSFGTATPNESQGLAGSPTSFSRSLGSKRNVTLTSPLRANRGQGECHAAPRDRRAVPIDPAALCPAASLLFIARFRLAAAPATPLDAVHAAPQEPGYVLADEQEDGEHDEAVVQAQDDDVRRHLEEDVVALRRRVDEPAHAEQRRYRSLHYRHPHGLRRTRDFSIYIRL